MRDRIRRMRWAAADVLLRFAVMVAGKEQWYPKKGGHRGLDWFEANVL